MDANSFQPENKAALDEPIRRLTARRKAALSASYRLFYRTPVHLVRGQGAYLWDANGKKYLDMYNNVASIGHAHPRVIEAVTRQMTDLNTHTRYLHEGVLSYAEDLLGTLPEQIDQIMFMCTGSEANDLAIRVARAHTAGSGIILSSEAYHGNTELTSRHSPALGGNQIVDPTSRLISPPDAFRQGLPDEAIGLWFAAEMQRTIDEMVNSGVPFAGFLADSVFSSDGVFAGSPGMLLPAIQVVHANGGLFIADEVQPGFGRMGDSFWGFDRHGIVPDIVTMGKPMGNGIPISGLAAKRSVLESFSLSVPYFNTYGGNPVSIAAAQAVLDVIREENLQERARLNGAALRAAIGTLLDKHEVIGDVRGAGQFTGLELVTDRDSRMPAGDLALTVIEEMRIRGVLTSVAGPGGNVLKLRPPLAFDTTDVDWLVSALDESITSAMG